MIRRQQIQLRPGEQTTAFTSTADLAEALSALADYEGKEAVAAINDDEQQTKKYHVARREAFLEALQIVSPV